MSDPHGPIAAVSHPNPYPYYARLVRDRPFHHDSELDLWIAASAESVNAVLASDLCRVRPPPEPVPPPITSTAAGDIFGRLVRMNDGDYHQALKPAISATLAGLDLARVITDARKWARELLTGRDQGPPFAFALPVYVLGSRLGIPDRRLARATSWVDDFVRCLSPSSSPEQIERSIAAASDLHDLFNSALEDSGTRPGGTLLRTLQSEIQRAGCDDPDAVAANGIGFLSQAYEATAGLIGNTLLALSADPELGGKVRSDPTLLRQVIAETLRHDSPIQNTRRFVVRDGELAGQAVQAGETILVLLAAANRDPAVHPHPERFDPSRGDARHATFGAGPHACPGGDPATLIAMAGVEQVLASGANPAAMVGAVAYYPSVNARIPIIPRLTAAARS